MATNMELLVNRVENWAKERGLDNSDYCQQKGWSISDCFQMAWDEIKNRKGKMVNGSYVKEQDLIGDVDGL